MQHTAWKDFNTGVWDKAIDVRDFIQRNYVPYEGDDSFPSWSYRTYYKIVGQGNETIRRRTRKRWHA